MALKCRTSPSPPNPCQQCLDWCVGGRGDCIQALGVNQSEMVASADLGSSSNYSNELHIEFNSIVKL